MWKVYKIVHEVSSKVRYMVPSVKNKQHGSNLITNPHKNLS